jgi:hypothetical protein
MNPKPLSLTRRLIVPFIAAIVISSNQSFRTRPCFEHPCCLRAYATDIGNGVTHRVAIQLAV